MQSASAAILTLLPALAFAQNSQPGSLPATVPSSAPTTNPTSHPVDPYDALQQEIATLESIVQKADLALDWLASHPDHPRAFEVKAQLSGYIQDLDTLLIEKEEHADEFLSEILGILDLDDPLARGEAARNLAARGDPRAVLPLIYALRDPSIAVRAEVARSLGAFSDPRAEAALEKILTSPREDPTVRTAAAASLGKQKTPSAARVLLAVFRDEDEDHKVRQAALRSVRENFPGLLSYTEEVVDRRGRWLLIPAAALFGSYALATVGSLGENEAGTTIGASGGLLLGGGGALLLSQRQEITVGQAAYLTTGGAWGLGLGLATGAMIEGEKFASGNPNRKLILGMGVLGEAAGLGFTLATKNSQPFDQYDMLTINLGGAIGITTALGILQFVRDNDNPANDLALTSALGIGGLVGTSLVTRKLRFSRGDIALTLLGAYEGAFLGNFLPLAFADADPALPPQEDLPERLSDGFFRIGLAQGALAGAALGQLVDVPASDVGEVFIAGSYGKLLGAGVPLLLGATRNRTTIGASLLGNTLGIASAATLSERLSFSDGDIALTAFGTAFGAFQGAALAANQQDDATLGAAMIGAGAAGLGSMLLSQRLSLSPWEVAGLASGGFWGIWFSLFATALDERPFAEDLLPIAIAADLGVAATATLLSPALSVSPTRIGITSLGGLAGAALFSLGGALFSQDNDTVILANLTGSALGLLGGALISKRLENKVPAPPRLRLAGIPRPSLSLLPLVPADPKAPAGIAIGLDFSQR